MNRIATLLKSKTVWGAVFATGGWLFAQPHIGPMEIIQAVGAVTTAAGARDAITKIGSPTP